MNAIHADIVEEARRVTAAAVTEKLPMRLIGGLAIRLHTEGGLPAALHRTYQDIDLVTTGKGSKGTIRLLRDLGYEPNERFNALNAGRRAVVYDYEHERQIDIFIGQFQMCHKLDLAARIDVDPLTIPLAELLLTKLQIVQLNRKDLVDIAALLHEHPVGERDEDTVNAAYIAKLLAGDWGLWRTSRGTINTVQERLPDLTLDTSAEQRIRERLHEIWERVEHEPKSLRWRSRAKIGERARWYEEPEEVDHDRAGTRL